MSNLASKIYQFAFQQLKDLFYLYRTLAFALRCTLKTDRQSWVICHDTTTSLPAFCACRHSGKIIFDVSETPSLRERTTDRFRQKYSLLPILMERISNFVLKRSHLLMASSTGFAKLIGERAGSPVLVSISYDEVPPCLATSTPRQTDAADGADTDEIRYIAWPSTFAGITGARLALEIVRAWPDNWQLVIIGDLAETDDLYGAAMALGRRVRITGPLDRADYLREIAHCDAALILFETVLENTRLCVPNRLYDCLAAGTPIVSTPHQSVSKVIAALPQCGKICEVPEPAAFVATLNDVFDRERPRLPTKAQVTTALDGISMQAALAKLLPPVGGDNHTVTILANRSIKGRHRITTMVSALHDLGYKTRVFAQR